MKKVFFFVDIRPLYYVGVLAREPVEFQKMENAIETFTIKKKLLSMELYTNNFNVDMLTPYLSIYNADYLVRFGFDTNQSKRLEQNELLGEYQIYSLTKRGHEFARSKFGAFVGWQNTLRGLFFSGSVRDLEYALIYKHLHGVFPDGDYNPTSISSQVYHGIDYDKITHKCGGKFQLGSITGKDLNASGRLKVKDLAVPDRNYPDGTVTLPVYSYSASSETAGLVGNSFGLRKKIKAFFCEKNLTEPAALKIRQQIAFINSKLGKVGESKTITLPVSYTGSYNAGALNRVGLGSADLNLSRIDLTVEKTEVEKTEVEKTEATKTGYDFIITGGAVWGEVKDIFDYNYFTGTDTTIEHDEAKGKACETNLLIKKHRATASGATIQCGFGRAGVKAGAGNVGSVVIELSNNRFTFNTPIQIRTNDNQCLNPDPSEPSCQ